ncbi:MAG: multiheme cytochrome [Desulfurococcales archaeon]|nr:multiheme cytochrome [Desulfurococcales archaeon]
MKRALSYLLLALMILSPLLTPQLFKAHSTQFTANSDMDRLQQALQLASPQTQQCIECHLEETPGIVFDWLNSKHAWHKPADVAEIYEAIGYENYTIADKFQNYNYTVGCYECHGMFKEQNRPDIASSHFGFQIVEIVTLKDCSQCHMKEAMEISWTMHSFAALNAPLKPWYAKIVKYAKENNETDTMLPPVYQKTGTGIVDWPWYMQYASKLLNNPNDPEVQQFGTIYDYDFKTIVSPLYPASGVLNSTGIMWNTSYKNAYVYHACLECHGSLVVPYQNQGYRVLYWGWPSNGAGRVDPDGSLGTCTACHTRHSFSLEEARKPETCGQCHLGYDHPHIEIYEHSKHGIIYSTEGERWNWTDLPWRVGVDFRAPTCATCHMSTIADPNGTIVVYGSHDLRSRIVWDTLHFFTFPKPKWADFTQNAIIKGGNQLNGKGLKQSGVLPEGYQFRVDQAPQPGELAFPRIKSVIYTGELKQKRDTMKSVCELCHNSQWVDNYFTTYDQNLIDYNVTANYAFSLLKKAWDEGIQDPSNKIDEYMELMWYYIWHHDGRRWRHGAAMMGPDYAHWFGIVDTVMDKLGRMVSYYQTAHRIIELQNEIQQLQAQAGNNTQVQQQIQQLQNQLIQLQQRLQAMEAQIPQLQNNISSLKAQFENLDMNLSEVSQQTENLNKTVSGLNANVTALQNNVSKIQSTIDEIRSTAEEATAKAGRAGVALGIGVIGLIIAAIALGLAARKPA